MGAASHRPYPRLGSAKRHSPFATDLEDEASLIVADQLAIASEEVTAENVNAPRASGTQAANAVCQEEKLPDVRPDAKRRAGLARQDRCLPYRAPVTGSSKRLFSEIGNGVDNASSLLVSGRDCNVDHQPQRVPWLNIPPRSESQSQAQPVSQQQAVQAVGVAAAPRSVAVNGEGNDIRDDEEPLHLPSPYPKLQPNSGDRNASKGNAQAAVERVDGARRAARKLGVSKNPQRKNGAGSKRDAGSEFDGLLRSHALDTYLHNAEVSDHLYQHKPSLAAGERGRAGGSAGPIVAESTNVRNIVPDACDSAEKTESQAKKVESSSRSKKDKTKFRSRRVIPSYAKPLEPRMASNAVASTGSPIWPPRSIPGPSSGKEGLAMEASPAASASTAPKSACTRLETTERSSALKTTATGLSTPSSVVEVDPGSVQGSADSKLIYTNSRAKRRKRSDDSSWRAALTLGSHSGIPTRKSPRLRHRRQRRVSKSPSPNAVIDLTQDANSEASVPPSAGIKKELSPSLDAEVAIKRNKASGAIPHAYGPVDTSYVEAPMLKPLTTEEHMLVDGLTKGKSHSDALATNPMANITLHRSDFKRLRGARWLNDELLNSYVALINTRNRLHSERSKGNGGTKLRPRTYMFNTYFYTRLVSTGYDYAGVARWSRRAKMDVLQQDLILVPVNLGNNHWILSGIDLANQCFLYLDSLYGRDSSDVVPALKQWLGDEVNDKHGSAKAKNLAVGSWEIRLNKYNFWRPPPAGQGGLVDCGQPPKRRQLKIPRQGDGGSCGVFTAKIADCLAMGCNIYFGQKDIKLIRSRMALDLYKRVLPG